VQRTWIVHVSSELKSTMGSPPLAISILFCGRNRATTTLSYSQYAISPCSVPVCGAPLIVFLWLHVSLSRSSKLAHNGGYIRHGCCTLQRSGPQAALWLLCSLSGAVSLRTQGELLLWYRHVVGSARGRW
jgi:hypothetical protein